MPTEVDSSSVFDTVLPNVYVKKVTLTPASIAGSRNGSEYDVGAGDTLETNEFGKKQANPANIDFNDIPRGPRGLAISVELLVKDRLGKNGKPSWFGNEDTSKYLNLRVVLSKRKQLTRDLLDRNFRPSYLKRARVQNQFEENIIDLGKLLSDSLEKEKRVVTDGETTYDITYTTTFFIPNVEPKNIAVFAHTFVNLTDVLQDKFILPRPGKRNYIQGNTTAQRIIVDGMIRENAYVYKTPEGKVWAGPVHRHDDQFMAGAFHTNDPHPVLERSRVSNFIIDDYRVLEELKEPELRIRPHRMSYNRKGSTKTSEDLKVLKTEAYITEPEFSTDAKNVLKFIFHIDHEKLVRDNTQYGALFETIDKAAKSEIIENSPIKDISIYRERVVRGLRRGQVKPVEYEDRTELIANSSERKAGNIKKSETRRSLQNGQKKSQKVIVGAMRQINLSANSDSGVRSIGITDYDMARETDGLYRYYVEMEVEDGTVPFVKRQHRKLSRSKNKLERFIILASDRRNTIPETGEFTYSFIRRESRREDISTAPWFEAILTYLDILSNVAMIRYPRLRMASRLLHNLCNPSSGNFHGLTTLLGLIQELESEMQDVLGEANPRIDEVDFSARTSGFKGKITKNTFRVKKNFKKVHDSNIQNNVGYDFLAGGSRNSTGPRQLTFGQLQTRLEQEGEKYFSPTSNGPVTRTNGASEQTQFQIPNPELASTFYSYLSPAIIYVGQKNVLKTINKGRNLFASEKFNLMISSILKSNSLFGSPSSTLQDNIDPTQPEFNIAPVLFLGSGYRDANTKISRDTYTNNLNNLLILDALNVTISSEDTYSAKTTLKDFADGLEILQAAYSDPESNLGATSNFSTDTLPVEDLLFSDELSVTGIEEQKDITGIGNTLIKSLVESNDFVFPKKSKKIERLDDLLLASTTNAIDEYFGDMPNGEEKKQKFIENLPIQIKSLVLTLNARVRKNWLTTRQNTGQDLIETPELFGLFYFLYSHLNMIQVFTGFERTRSGEVQISKPIYRRLTVELLEEMRLNNQAALCRMVPYRNNVIGFKKSPKLKMPEFDSVFMIRPENSQQVAQAQNVAVSQTSTASNTNTAGQTTSQNFSQQTQEANLNLTGKKLMEELLSLVNGQDDIPPEFSSTATVLQPRGVVRVGTTFSSRTPTPPTPTSGINVAQNNITQARSRASVYPPGENRSLREGVTDETPTDTRTPSGRTTSGGRY